MALNVLVVDDSSVMRTMIIRTMRLSGLPLGDVHQAANGKEGLEILDRSQVDLALVDLNMPVLGGEEMINMLRGRAEYADLPLIVISTEGSETRIERLKDKGVRFVHKPFGPRSIREAVVDLTGVTDEHNAGKEAVSGGGPDF